jgi:hypothetical protein
MADQKIINVNVDELFSTINAVKKSRSLRHSSLEPPTNGSRADATAHPSGTSIVCKGPRKSLRAGCGRAPSAAGWTAPNPVSTHWLPGHATSTIVYHAAAKVKLNRWN